MNKFTITIDFIKLNLFSNPYLIRDYIEIENILEKYIEIYDNNNKTKTFKYEVIEPCNIKLYTLMINIELIIFIIKLSKDSLNNNKCYILNFYNKQINDFIHIIYNESVFFDTSNDFTKYNIMKFIRLLWNWNTTNKIVMDKYEMEINIKVENYIPSLKLLTKPYIIEYTKNKIIECKQIWGHNVDVYKRKCDVFLKYKEYISTGCEKEYPLYKIKEELSKIY
jgi:hypothetical protein